MKLDVVTKIGAVVRGMDATEVVLPGVLGEMGILPGHKALIAGLGVGPMIVRNGTEEAWFALAGGFVEVLGEDVRVLTETCERADQIDVERARAKLAESTARLDTVPPTEHELYNVVRESIRKAETRINVGGRKAH
ncbi:MAG TPA: ATP synthase F1 subunit epsilon [Myxococcota bacterium]|jgi:F-type H+-transporting ATPase subunit epsilon|nr:ATP synthase F1 subunit epsilon [Myxococcota bacterium]